MVRVVVLVGLLGLGGVAGADWRPADTVRQAAYLSLHYADWRQTIQLAEHPDYHELNPIIGKHPSRQRVDNYFAATAVAHTAVSVMLPPRWRSRWQYFTIATQGLVVHHNYQIGWRVDF